jgi:hypothetical protein
VTDFNGDGHTDIVWRNMDTGQNAFWLMNGTSLVTIADLPTLDNPDYEMGGVADFNQDGTPDIVWRNQVTGANAIWMMNGTSLGSIVDLPALPNTDYRICGAGNFWDNETYSSYIIWRNYATGQNAVWILVNASLAGIMDLPALPNPDYKLIGAGDFNNDGGLDIVWRNQTTGQNAFWVPDVDTGDMQIVDLPALPNTNYYIGGLGDFNRDGNLDIIWRNFQTGQDALWIMDGAALWGITDLPALPNPNYTIAGPR